MSHASKSAHSARCILRDPCALADTSDCNPLCASFIAMHGYSGSGGRVAAANIPQDYRMLTLANSPARTEQAKVYAILAEYAATFTRMFEADGKRIKSVYLYSREPGTGKTTSACALANEYLIRNYIGSVQRNRQPLERPAFFVDVNAWQSLYNGFNRNGIPQDVAEPIAREYYRQERLAKETPFVVLDDIGVRSATDAFRSDLHGVINARVTNAMPTVYTSNVAMVDLSDVFDARLADRIRDQTVEIVYSGESRRGMR